MAKAAHDGRHEKRATTRLDRRYAARSRYDVADRAPQRCRRPAAALGDDPRSSCSPRSIVVNTLVSPYFLDLYNLSDMTQNFSEKAIIALGMALLILVREIDLSVAAIIALASLGIGFAAAHGFGPPALIVTGARWSAARAAPSTACS